MVFKLHTSLAVRLCSLALSTLALHCVQAQVSSQARTVLAHAVDERHWMRLAGNTRPEATSINDRGAVGGDTKLEHMFLQLQRPPEREQALEAFLNELADPNSPNFHKWISPQQFGSRFGLAQADLDAVTQWLESHGFSVHGITPNLVVDFSGTAAQVQSAFRTRIHHLSVGGQIHFANMSDPQIPASLVPLVSGVVSLNDFKPHPLRHVATKEPIAEYTTSSGTFPVVPQDLSTIYNFTPAFQAGFSGRGQTIAVLEDSDIYSTGDWLVFRKVFGLARRYPEGHLVTVHPRSSTGEACTDPGVNADSVEAAIDAEWASAAAPSATIVVASCYGSNLSGIFTALQNLLTNGDTPPEIISISYGMPEGFLGASQQDFIRSLYQMAVAEGVSVFVGTGDSGAAGYDGGPYPASGGIAVNGLSSTPYNVAVGGTDFADKFFGTIANYWSSSNSPVYGSALSYVPEIPWNDSCGSELLANSMGFATTYGATGFCNNGNPKYQSAIAGGGGPSSCAFGSPGGLGGAGNTCAGYPKPSWQSIVGNPNDGVRDLPDVSLFASNNVWGHYYVTCFSDPVHGGKSCLGGDPSTWSGFGGTSLSAPTMAGIQALINQKTGSRWGNPDPIYYGLAAAEYGSSGNSTCNASASSPENSCVFHDITLGDMSVACLGSNNCFYGDNPGTNGVLSLSNSAYQPAYAAGLGWDFATGIGTVNVWNLLTSWPNASTVSSTF